jgi:iron(III) transport system permease protein
MANDTAAGSLVRARAHWPHVDSGVASLWVLILVSALVVLPPFFYLLQSSFSVPVPGFRTSFGLENYQRVFEISGARLWAVTLAFALGSSIMAIFLGFTAAWLLARTNVPFRQTVFVVVLICIAKVFIVL